MKIIQLNLFVAAVVVFGTLLGCSTTSTRAADVSDSVRKSLDRAGLKEVSVSQDRDKGVLTLSGNVAADADKLQAAAIAKAVAGQQVVSNEIAVLPPGGENDAKMVNPALDKGIEGNLDAALIKDNLHENVKYTVKNHVVTLSGDVDSPAKRAHAAAIAAAVLNVHQVVNEVQVKGQKASSTN